MLMPQTFCHLLSVIGLLTLGMSTTSPASGDPADADWITFRKNGGWCWYQDERAIIDDGHVIFGSVAGTDAHGYDGGDVIVTRYDLTSGERRHFELHNQLNQDDHAAPALLELPDGRYLAMYATHGHDPYSRYRITKEAGSIAAWTGERQFKHPRGHPTYSNLLRPSPDRIFNFTRTAGIDPHVMVSNDNGRTWELAGRLLDWPDRPYLKYADHTDGTIHFIATDGHPRQMPNNIYHGYLRDGKIHTSAGQVVGQLDATGLQEKSLTRVFEGDPHNVAWTTDLHLDSDGNPVIAFSVQKDGAAIQSNAAEGPAWDHRYFYGRWDGQDWHVHEMAYAGTGFYPREADYTGLVAIDPEQPDTVFISTDVDPKTGLANVSDRDDQRHYEIFKGVTDDDGRSWQWTQITRDSTVDNIRPVIPIGGGDQRFVLWSRGTLTTYTDYDLDVVGLIESR